MAIIVHFEAAHRLPHVSPDHRCYRIHGHSYRCELVTSGRQEHAQKTLEQIISPLRHCYLNDLPELDNPTSEMISLWVWRSLVKKGVQPCEITISENDDSACVYRGELWT